MNDFEQCSNQIQFDLISLLITFSYEFEKIMSDRPLVCIQLLGDDVD